MKIPAAWEKKTGLSYVIVKTVEGASAMIYWGTDIYDAVMDFHLQIGLMGPGKGEIALINSEGDWLERFSR